MSYDIDKLSKQFNNIDKIRKELDVDEKIKKYGTFLDSKKEIVHLYMLFLFFGIHGEIMNQLRIIHDYDPD